MKSQKPFESQGLRLLRQLLLDGRQIFNMQDVRKITSAKKIAQIRKILSNLAKREKILRLRRGLYVIIGLLPDQHQPHPFVISTHLIQPSAVSHWSALQYHGLTEQIPQIITASTPHKVVTPSMREKIPIPTKSKHVWIINNVHYEYITVQQKNFFGIEKIWVDENYQIPITDKERTLLDVFIYPKMFGGIGEALGILENSIATMNITRLIQYATRYSKKSVCKRLGWALEYFGVSAQELEPLLKISINYYYRLDPSGPKIGPCDKRWMIQNNLTKIKSK